MTMWTPWSKAKEERKKEKRVRLACVCRSEGGYSALWEVAKIYRWEVTNVTIPADGPVTQCSWCHFTTAAPHVKSRVFIASHSADGVNGSQDSKEFDALLKFLNEGQGPLTYEHVYFSWYEV